MPQPSISKGTSEPGGGHLGGACPLAAAPAGTYGPRSLYRFAFLGTVTAGIGAVVISQQRTKSREIAEAHRPLKTELYMSFASEIVDLMRSGKGNVGLDAKAQKLLEDFFFDFTTKIMMWGSPDVLAAYGKFRRIGENPEIVLLVDDVLQAMRNDLGLSNSNLKRGDLIKMLLTDPDTVDRMLNAKKGGS